MKRLNLLFLIVLTGILMTGCITVPPKDYTLFREHQPRSILILPPRNLSTEINANYSFYTQSIKPIAEMGYYVYPSVLVDQYFKENGILIADEMHTIPLDKLYEVFRADAVLYINVEQYGTKYIVISSNVIVVANATLVDSITGKTIWEGRVQYNQSGSSGIIEALVEQVINKLSDQAHIGAGFAAINLFQPTGQGLLKGVRHPEFGIPES